MSTLSLFLATESNSSNTIILGWFSIAPSNKVRKFSSDSPTHFDLSSEPFSFRKNALDSLARDSAIKVFPVPGGPVSIMPWFTLIFSKASGYFIGNKTPFFNSSIALS